MKLGEEKKDILGDILSGSQDQVVEGLEELNKIINLEGISSTGSGSPRKDSIPEKKEIGKSKRKTSHYLTEKVFDELGETKYELRELNPSINKSRVTKSRKVEMSIKTNL
jgi:hypothetical protein